MSCQSRSLTVGGRVFTAADIARLVSGTTGVILYSFASSANNFTTWRSSNASAGYQVGGGVTLKCLAIAAMWTAGTQFSGLNLLYGDTAVNDTSAPTNPVYVGGQSSTNSTILGGYSPNFSNSQWAGYFEVPTGKYPCARFFNSAGAATMYCFID